MSNPMVLIAKSPITHENQPVYKLPITKYLGLSVSWACDVYPCNHLHVMVCGQNGEVFQHVNSNLLKPFFKDGSIECNLLDLLELIKKIRIRRAKLNKWI